MSLKAEHSSHSDSQQPLSLASTQKLCCHCGEEQSPVAEYEEMIQKLEGDVRNHIRIEQQLKLHIESIQNKLEDIERQKDNHSKKNIDQIE